MPHFGPWTPKPRPRAPQPHLAEPPSETPATLPAAAAPLAGTLSDPLAAPGGPVGVLAPSGAAPHSPRPPPLKCRPAGLTRPGVTSSDIRVTSRGPWLAQGPRPRATKCPRHPGTPLERRGGARGRRGGGLGAGRGAHRAAPGARGRRNRSETAQVPPGETVQGDPGDPPGRSETPSGQPQQPLGGAGWLDWPAGTSRGRHAANRLKVVMKYP